MTAVAVGYWQGCCRDRSGWFLRAMLRFRAPPAALYWLKPIAVTLPEDFPRNWSLGRSCSTCLQHDLDLDGALCPDTSQSVFLHS